MPRPKKEGTHINLILRQDIYDRFVAYAERKGQTKTMAMERILEKALDEEDQKQKGSYNPN